MQTRSGICQALMRQLAQCCFFVAVAMVFTLPTVGPSVGAKIEQRADLLDHILSLRRVFPQRILPDILNVHGINYAPSPLIGTADTSALVTDVLFIEGELLPGDTTRIKDALRSSEAFFIVFDSPGGQFSEGLLLGEFLETFHNWYEGGDQGLLRGVVVLDGGQCLSACGLAFAQAPKGMRFVETGGILGFHMPYLPPSASAQAAEVNRTLNIAYDVVKAMSIVVARQNTPPELLIKMLEFRGGDQMYRLGAGEEAWLMGFDPVSNSVASDEAPTGAIDPYTVAGLCDWYRLRAFGLTLGKLDDLVSIFGHPPPLDRVGPGNAVAMAQEAGYHCAYEKHVDGTVGVALLLEKPGCIAPLEEAFNVQADALADSTTFDRACQIAASDIAPVTRGMVAASMGCNLDGSVDPIMTGSMGVGTKVNVRREASASSDILTLLDGPAFGSSDPNSTHDAFLVLGCRVTNDSQGVWYYVRVGHETGWVSAKFVRAAAG